MKSCCFAFKVGLSFLLVGIGFSTIHPLNAGQVVPALSCASPKATGEYYSYWKQKYLKPSVRFPGDFKVNYNGKGATVSEAMGYGMLITALMADEDPEAKKKFDGLNRFRKRFPSSINPAFMCWKIPANERPGKNDCATDGELDIAYALLLAHAKWGDDAYQMEAKNLIRAIGSSLVRPDFSLRLGDWNEAPGQTRPSDVMPTHFRAFADATGDLLWKNVEDRSYHILNELQLHQFQSGSTVTTGLVPDFAIERKGHWVPARPCFLEGRHDGDYYYNACRVPWRIAWAALGTHDVRAKKMLGRFMQWSVMNVKDPDGFRAGYRLDGHPLHNSDFETACFITPTGVAAMALGMTPWKEKVERYALASREEYYEDSINLLCLILMEGNPRSESHQTH